MTPLCQDDHMILHWTKSLARQMKHQLYTGQSRKHRLALSIVESIAARVTPFRFDPLRYPSHRFLRFDGPAATPRNAPARIFCFWTGSNEMPEVRRMNLDRLTEDAGVDVVLITPDSLDEWVVPEHPINSALHNLSLTHRSDYLRAYFMHYHGGGY